MSGGSREMIKRSESGGGGEGGGGHGSLADKIPDLIMQGAGATAIKSVIVYDLTTRVVPMVVGGIVRWIGRRLENRAKRMCKRVLAAGVGDEKKRQKTAVMVLERRFGCDQASSGNGSDMFDAVLSIATDVVDARVIRRTAKGVFVIDTCDEIRFGSDVYFKKLQIKEVDGELEQMSIQVYSFGRNIVELRTYLNNLEADYVKTKGNQLGRQLYYFDEVPVTPPLRMEGLGAGLGGGGGAGTGSGVRGVPDLSKAFPNITFNMFALHTNKSLKNLYGESVRNAKKRVEFFVNNPQWYQERGIPYTLGILMHGAPGCGKTSFIKAVARDTGRHVVNIKMGPTTTVQQINNLFYTPRLSVVRDGAAQTFDIPMDKRIIVMEDVDCLSCVFRDAPGAAADPHQLNLSILLNILDGVLETPGRIVIMTTNKPDVLDLALKRPGRIDVNIEFKKCSAADTVEMIQGISGWRVPPEKVEEIESGVFTPAEVTKVIFENMDEPENCLRVLKKRGGKRKEEKGILTYADVLKNMENENKNEHAPILPDRNKLLDTSLQQIYRDVLNQVENVKEKEGSWHQLGEKQNLGQEVFFPGVSEEEKEKIKKEAERVPILDMRGGFAEEDWQQRFDQDAKVPFSKIEFDGKFFEGFLDNQAFGSIHAGFELADGTIPQVWSASQLSPVL